MTQDERNSVGIAIAITAQYYGRELKKEVVAMMVSDLEDLSATEVLSGYNTYRKDGRNRTFPLPAQIRDLLSPQLTPDNASREISAKIIQAISRYGYSNPDFAKEFVGEIGWSIVRAYGGWQYLCENLGTNLSVDTFNAQARELIKGRVIHGEDLGNMVKELPYRKTPISELEFQDHKQTEINKGMALVASLESQIKTLGE